MPGEPERKSRQPINNESYRTMKITSLLLLACSSAAFADIKLPAIFSDHLVLQREAPVPVWGWAEPG